MSDGPSIISSTFYIQILVRLEFQQSIPTVVHTVRELQLWIKGIQCSHHSTMSSYSGSYSSSFTFWSSKLALEATEPVSKPVTQMAVEMINIDLISVQQKRWVYKLHHFLYKNHNIQLLKCCWMLLTSFWTSHLQMMNSHTDKCRVYRIVLWEWRGIQVGHVGQLNGLVSLTKNYIFTKGTNNFINNLWADLAWLRE